MNYGDLILTPVFVLILYLFFYLLRSRYKDPLLKKYHRQGFWIKIIGCIAFFIYNVYLSRGDSIGLYQCEGNNLYHLILKNTSNLKYVFQSGKNFNLTLVKNPGNTGYFGSDANFMVIRLDALFSFITFGRYSAISLLFAAIAFSGIWKLFLFFYEQFPNLHKKFAIAILFFPTVVFWSSGVMKDTLCIAAIGWITYSVYEIFFRKKNIIKNSIILFIFSYLLIVIKVYILLAYVPFFMLFIVLKNLQGVRKKFLKYMLAPTLIGLSIFAFTQVLSSYDQELGAYAVGEITTNISHLNTAMAQKDGEEDADSNFKLGAEFDGSYTGLIKIAPLAIATTFFRPFIWESHKLSQLMAALESLVLMFFTLFIIFKSGLRSLIKLILTDPLIMYCFLFSVVFALFIGASTLNFGTLVRYKIPCLPFYAISLFLIYEKVKEKSYKKSFQLANPITNSDIPLYQVAS
jgi:hypothetical protein